MVTKREPKKIKTNKQNRQKKKKKGLVYFTFKNKPSRSYNQINLMSYIYGPIVSKGD